VSGVAAAAEVAAFLARAIVRRKASPRTDSAPRPLAIPS
jgi:hypothetical protein